MATPEPALPGFGSQPPSVKIFTSFESSVISLAEYVFIVCRDDGFLALLFGVPLLLVKVVPENAASASARVLNDLYLAPANASTCFLQVFQSVKIPVCKNFSIVPLITSNSLMI